MTDQGGFTLSPELLEQIVTNGFNYLPEIIREMINMAMRFERQQYLGAAPYQRTFEYPHLFLDAHYEKVRQDG